MPARRLRDHRNVSPVPGPVRRQDGMSPQFPPVPRALPIALAIYLALWVAAGIAPSNWLWGLDQISCLPMAASLALLGLAGAGFVPLLRGGMGGILDRVGEAARSRPALADVLTGMTVGAIVFALRDPVHFVGDSGLRVGMLATRYPAAQLFPQAYPLDVLVNAHLARALTGFGLTGEQSLDVLGALMAALYAAIGLAFVREAGGRGRMIPVCALILLGGGAMIALPGYDKFGPLMVGTALAALGALRLSRSAGGAWSLAAGTAVAVLSHRTGYLIVPAAALAFLQAFRAAKNPSLRGNLVAAAVVTGLVSAALLPRTMQLLLRFDLATHVFAPAPSGMPAGGPGNLLLRLSDVVNLLFFMTPLWVVGATAGLFLLRSRKADGVVRTSLAPVAALALAAQLVVALATRGQQGPARDWDMHSGLGVILGLVTCHLLIRAARVADLRSLWVPLGTGALAITISLWSVFANEPAQLRRIEGQLRGRPSWDVAARARALDFLGLRAFNLGRFEEAANEFERAVEVAPNPRYFYQAGLARWRAGQPAAARELAIESARRAPRNADPWWVLAAVARAAGDSSRMAACLDSARVRGSTGPPPGL